jgi:hypothetical protein
MGLTEETEYIIAHYAIYRKGGMGRDSAKLNLLCISALFLCNASKSGLTKRKVSWAHVSLLTAPMFMLYVIGFKDGSD